jgi:hypothetical protein
MASSTIRLPSRWFVAASTTSSSWSAASSPNDAKIQAQLSGNYFRISHALGATGDLNDALAAVRKTLPITQKLASASTDPELADHFAGSHYFIAGASHPNG